MSEWGGTERIMLRTQADSCLVRGGGRRGNKHFRSAICFFQKCAKNKDVHGWSVSFYCLPIYILCWWYSCCGRCCCLLPVVCFCCLFLVVAIVVAVVALFECVRPEQTAKPNKTNKRKQNANAQTRITKKTNPKRKKNKHKGKKQTQTQKKTNANKQS